MLVSRRVLIAGLAGTGFGLCGFVPAARAGVVDLSPEQPGRLHASRNDAAIALVPTTFDFVTPGTLTVGNAPSNPPLSTYATDAETVVGNEPDIAWLLAESLGLKARIVPTAWADWPLGLQSGKFDAVISNVTVTEERKAKFDFSTYRRDDLGFYVAIDSRITSIREPKDVAGLRIIVSSGTNQEKVLLEWDRQNVAAGLKPVEFQVLPGRNAEGVGDRLRSCRCDARTQCECGLSRGPQGRYQVGGHRQWRVAAVRGNRRDHAQGQRHRRCLHRGDQRPDRQRGVCAAA